MDQNKLKDILDEEDIEIFNKMPWVQECTKVPTVFQIYDNETNSYPLFKIIREKSSGETVIEPRYIFGRKNDYSEVYVFDKMMKRKGEEFYIPMTHVGRAFKIGLHRIESSRIIDINTDY